MRSRRRTLLHSLLISPTAIRRSRLLRKPPGGVSPHEGTGASISWRPPDVQTHRLAVWPDSLAACSWAAVRPRRPLPDLCPQRGQARAQGSSSVTEAPLDLTLAGTPRMGRLRVQRRRTHDATDGSVRYRPVRTNGASSDPPDHPYAGRRKQEAASSTEEACLEVGSQDRLQA